MSQDIEKNNLKKIFLFAAGSAMLIIGVALILREWAYLVIIFKGAIGVVFSLVGLFLMFIAK